ncbi:MAG: ABC transporter permease [Capsulimonadaceae bacterium]|nr:ABC transporter permease [Capsulimonadaceae bacterium]
MGMVERTEGHVERSAQGAVARNSHPLSPLTYCRRNIRRLLPMAVVIVLSVFLVASVVTIVDSVDLTVTTVYNYTRVLTVVIPQRSSLAIDPDDRNRIAGIPGVDRIIDGSGFFMSLNTVFGATPFLVMAVTDSSRNYILQRANDHLSAGRMPVPGAAEAVLSDGIVRNKRLRIGDVVAGPDDQGGLAGCPLPVRLVGIVTGPTWIAFTTPEFANAAMPLFPRHLIVTAKDQDALPAISSRMLAVVNRSKVQVLSYRTLVEQIRTTLDSMYLIMSLVNAMVILVVALMSGMLSNIYFTQRLTEFALLSAIGIRRSTLLWHAVSETAVVTSIGWLAGMIVTWILMALMKESVFERRGMLINPHDVMALAYTVPIPFIITAFAMATIFIRLAKLDPVTIIERR